MIRRIRETLDTYKLIKKKEKKRKKENLKKEKKEEGKKERGGLGRESPVVTPRHDNVN